MYIKIRKCRIEDAAFLARAILVAGRAHVSKGIWEVVLDTTEDECIRFLELAVSTETQHLFHFSCYFIAETEDKIPAGSLGGYDPSQLGYQALQNALPEVYKKLQLPGLEFESTNNRASKILACLPKEADPAWVIDSVATMPDYRGRGVAEQMLHAVLEEGKKLGYPVAQVNMYKGNEPALHLYQKLGFKVIEETSDPYFEKMIGSPGMLSLTRALQ